MAIDRHSNSDDYFTIFHKNGGNPETKYSFIGTKGDNGTTIINCYNNHPSVQIRRNNSKLQGRLECTVFRPTALIPKGNGTQDSVNYSGITTTTDGWNNLKISRLMCSTGAKNNDVVLLNIQRGNDYQIQSEWAQIFNTVNGYKYVRTFGFNNTVNHELKFYDNSNTTSRHALKHHHNNWWGSYVNNCRIASESDWKKEGHMDSFLRSYGNNQNY